MSANAQSRRSFVLAGIAAPAAAVIPAALAHASGPDPVFALVEAERRAWSVWEQCLGELAKADYSGRSGANRRTSQDGRAAGG